MYYKHNTGANIPFALLLLPQQQSTVIRLESVYTNIRILPHVMLTKCYRTFIVLRFSNSYQLSKLRNGTSMSWAACEATSKPNQIGISQVLVYINLFIKFNESTIKLVPTSKISSYVLKKTKKK